MLPRCALTKKKAAQNGQAPLGPRPFIFECRRRTLARSRPPSARGDILGHCSAIPRLHRGINDLFAANSPFAPFAGRHCGGINLKMSKSRTPIPDDISAEVMFQHDRTCCVCHDRGLAVQIHHIDVDPTNHAVSNLAVLCLEHHEQTQMRGGFAKKLKAADVVRSRNDWICRVRVRRDKTDELVIQHMAGMAPTKLDDWKIPSRAKVVGFLNSLPSIRRAAIAAAQPLWETGITSEVWQGSYDAINLLESAWLRLANFYPPSHFGERNHFFSEFIAARFEWHRKICEPRGSGSSGEIVHLLTGVSVLDDVAKAIEETVDELFIGFCLGPFDLEKWRNDWHAAGAPLPRSRQ
jgi:hypothetical protein